MQKGFKSSQCEKTINNIIDLIKQAKHDNAFIIVARYSWNRKCGPTFGGTLKKIRRHLWKYPHVKHCKQDNEDKSRSIQRTLSRLDGTFPTKKGFRICGVNTDMCVRNTVYGLSQRYPETDIIVHLDACNTSSSTCVTNSKLLTMFCENQHVSLQ